MKATVINFFESIDQQDADLHRYEYVTVLTREEAKAEFETMAAHNDYEYCEVKNYDEDGDLCEMYAIWNDGTVEDMEWM